MILNEYYATANENHYTMTFGGDYDFKYGTESIILSAGGAESMMLSA
jgi:hypothetical protein